MLFSHEQNTDVVFSKMTRVWEGNEITFML